MKSKTMWRVLSLLSVLAMMVGMLAGLTLVTAAEETEDGDDQTAAKTVFTAEFSDAENGPTYDGLELFSFEGTYGYRTVEGKTGIHTNRETDMSYLYLAIADKESVGITKDTNYFSISLDLYNPVAGNGVWLQYNKLPPETVTVDRMYKVTRDGEGNITALTETNNVVLTYEQLMENENTIWAYGVNRDAYETDGTISCYAQQSDEKAKIWTTTDDNGDEYAPITLYDGTETYKFGTNGNKTTNVSAQLRSSWNFQSTTQITMSQVGWQTVTFKVTDAWFRNAAAGKDFRVTYNKNHAGENSIVLNKVTVTKLTPVTAPDEYTAIADFTQVPATDTVNNNIIPDLAGFSKVNYEGPDNLQIKEVDGLTGLTRKSSGVGYFYPFVTNHDMWAKQAKLIVELKVYSTTPNFGVKVQYNTSDPNHNNLAYKDAYGYTSGTGWETISVVIDDAQFASKQNGGGDFRVALENENVLINSVTLRVNTGYDAASGLLNLSTKATTKEWQAAYDALKKALADDAKTSVLTEVEALNKALQGLENTYYLSFSDMAGTTRAKNDSIYYGNWQAASAWGSADTSAVAELPSGSKLAYVSDGEGAGLELTDGAVGYVYLKNDVFCGPAYNNGKVTSAGTQAHSDFMKANNGKMLKVSIRAKAGEESSGELQIQFGGRTTLSASGTDEVTKKFNVSRDGGWQTYVAYIPIIDAQDTLETVGQTATSYDSLCGINGNGGRVAIGQGVTVESVLMEVVDATGELSDNMTIGMLLHNSISMELGMDAGTLDLFMDITKLDAATAADERDMTITMTMSNGPAVTETQKISAWRDVTLLMILDNIKPHQMQETITVTVTVSATSLQPAVTVTKTITIEQYLKKVCEDEENTANVRNLATTVARYGAAAQAYLEKADSNLTFDNKVSVDGELAEPTKPTGTFTMTGEADTAKWKSVTLLLKDDVTLRVRFEAAAGEYMVSYGDGFKGDTEAAIADPGNKGVYYFDLAMNPLSYDTDISFTVLIGETAVSKELKVSVNYYLAQMWESTEYDGTLAALVKAIANYSEYVHALYED